MAATRFAGRARMALLSEKSMFHVKALGQVNNREEETLVMVVRFMHSNPFPLVSNLCTQEQGIFALACFDYFIVFVF